MWHVTCDMWLVTRDMWLVTCDTWHVTCDMFFCFFGGGWTFSQNFGSLALTVCDLWYYEDLEEKADSINEWMSDEAVYRTAPATPGLLIIEVTHSRRSGRGRGRGVIVCLLKLFFPNSWSCPQTYLGDGRRRKLPLDGATDFLTTIWQHITTGIFVSAFILVLTRKPKNASKRVWLGLNIIQFILNLYVDVFL